jgi:pimeloyl-ACP methyl ester carboxylesterase
MIMSTVTSADGTTIGYERAGSGPPVILVDGALCHRGMGPALPLAKELAGQFTVYTYDRRGRGESSDTKPYSVQREVEDLEAVLKEAGGSACVYGISSGAALALEAANRGLGIEKLALYEAPFIVDDKIAARPADYVDRLDAMIAADDRSAAVRTFMKTVGMPGILIALMRITPAWKKVKSTAHTLPYDFRVLGDTGSGKPLPADRWTSVTAPALVMDGGKSPAWMRNGMRQLSEVLGAPYRTLPGQTHMLKPQAVAPVLTEFFGG